MRFLHYTFNVDEVAVDVLISVVAVLLVVCFVFEFAAFNDSIQLISFFKSAFRDIYIYYYPKLRYD